MSYETVKRSGCLRTVILAFILAFAMKSCDNFGAQNNQDCMSDPAVNQQG